MKCFLKLIFLYDLTFLEAKPCDRGMELSTYNQKRRGQEFKGHDDRILTAGKNRGHCRTDHHWK